MTNLVNQVLYHKIEEQLLSNFSIDKFLRQIDIALPLNIIGRQAATLRTCILKHEPRLKVNVIFPLFSDEKVDHYSAAEKKDIAYVPFNDLGDYLILRSVTIFLNPFLAQWILSQPKIINQISLATFEWVILPLFVKQENFYNIYSNGFSFDEPLHDDGSSSRWCWATSHNATVFILNCNQAGKYRVSFTLASNFPGCFFVTIADLNQMYRCPSSKEKSSDFFCNTFVFDCYLQQGTNKLFISFDGAPLIPSQPLEQRKKLYFCYSNTSLLRLDSDQGSDMVNTNNFFIDNVVVPVLDRVIRRIFHSNGFFEINTIGTDSELLAGMVGVKSCFDYQEGFVYRGFLYNHNLSITNGHSKLECPVMWYSLRKTTTPFSEF
ncbi:MAG: hypothetical protein A2X78_03025 [Gammaproteobacteria bacterium GWE2_37_16]|nr:MAG: hypothetical protein A2X78_03025 [Gammaproteobacteria bacterium GWE2_37_16]